jgi:hypothetical protein
LFTSLLRFQQDDDEEHGVLGSINNSKVLTINSSINSLDVKGYNYKLDTGFLHPLVFENINELSFSGTVNSIASDLFKTFGILTIIISFASLGNFYRKIGIDWMSSLSNLSTVQLSSFVPYTYPDRDFCIFSKFPMNKTILLILNDPGPYGSLTFAWLCQNGGTLKGNYDSPMDMPSNPISCKNWTVNSDDLKNMLKLCGLKSKNNDSSQQQSSNAYPSYPDYSGVARNFRGLR